MAPEGAPRSLPGRHPDDRDLPPITQPGRVLPDPQPGQRRVPTGNDLASSREEAPSPPPRPAAVLVPRVASALGGERTMSPLRTRGNALMSSRPSGRQGAEEI